MVHQTGVGLDRQAGRHVRPEIAALEQRGESCQHARDQHTDVHVFVVELNLARLEEDRSREPPSVMSSAVALATKRSISRRRSSFPNVSRSARLVSVTAPSGFRTSVDNVASTAARTAPASVRRSSTSRRSSARRALLRAMAAVVASIANASTS